MTYESSPDVLAASEILSLSRATGSSSEPVRVLRAELENLIEAQGRLRSALQSLAIERKRSARLLVCSERRWVGLADGKRLDLERHQALWRLMVAFVEAHRQSRGVALTIEQLIAIGWPNERVMPDAGARRVYTAVSSLRTKGLGRMLIKRDDGYLLSPDVTIETLD